MGDLPSGMGGDRGGDLPSGMKSGGGAVQEQVRAQRFEHFTAAGLGEDQKMGSLSRTGAVLEIPSSVNNHHGHFSAFSLSEGHDDSIRSGMASGTGGSVAFVQDIPRVNIDLSLTGRVVVSMTSIPKRNGTFGATIASLLSQTRPPDEIRLYLGPGCEEYAGDKVVCVRIEDKGPVTKLYAVVDTAVPDDAVIITVDDDMAYAPGWLDALLKGADSYRDDAVVGNGWDAGETWVRPGDLCDVGEGWAGAVYRKFFFDKDVLSPPAAFKNDDIWISQYLRQRGIRRRVVSVPRPAPLPTSDDGLHTRQDFKETNQIALALDFSDFPRVLSCHSPHERCGIAEYGRQLDSALVNEGCKVSHRTFDDVNGYFSRRGVLLVHYEPSFIRPYTMSDFRTHRERGLKVVFCAHHFHHSALNTWGGEVDRVVVHRAYDRVSGEKVVEIPLACPVYVPTSSREELRKRFGLPLGARVLTTLGFLAQWKCIPDVLCNILEMDNDVFVQVLTPHPFNGKNVTEEQSVYAVIQRVGKDRVYFSTDFRSESDLLDRVHASDIGFLFHGQNTGSVSAATKQFISARTPLVINSTNHTSDVGGSVRRVDTTDVMDFARSVVLTARDDSAINSLRANAESEYERLNMQTIAKQYVNLFRKVTHGL